MCACMREEKWDTQRDIGLSSGFAPNINQHTHKHTFTKTSLLYNRQNYYNIRINFWDDIRIYIDSYDGSWDVSLIKLRHKIAASQQGTFLTFYEHGETFQGKWNSL